MSIFSEYDKFYGFNQENICNNVQLGIKTCILKLDEAIKGLRRGFLYVIDGKSELDNMNLLLNIYSNLIQKNVIFFSTKFNKFDLLVRLCSIYTNYPIKILDGDYPEEVSKKIEDLKNKEIFIEDGISRIEDIGEKIQEKQLDVLFVSSLDELKDENATRKLKKFAMEKNIPIVAVASVKGEKNNGLCEYINSADLLMQIEKGFCNSADVHFYPLCNQNYFERINIPAGVKLDITLTGNVS